MHRIWGHWPLERESKFVIHQYINNGYHIVLDVNSGSVHVVDPVVYDAVQLVSQRIPEMEAPAALPSDVKEEVRVCLKDRYSQEDIEEALEEIGQLIEAEQLLTKDIYRDFVVDFKKRKTVVKALCLHIAHDCNLACRYCFAEEGEYHGRRALMSYEVGKKALDFLIANSGNREHLEVDFFGGEPLMNWDVVKRLVEYGRSQEEAHHKKFRFTLTTNGVLLNDEVMEFCNREMSNVVLSLDGRRDVNDKMRPFRNGSGSYDLIVPKFQKFADSRKQMNYYVRGTFTRNNLDFADDVLHYADLGFEQMALEYIKRKKEGRGFNFFHFMLDLKAGPCVAKRMAGCGSGTEYLAVTPWGDLYPCHQFVGNEKFLMGNVDTGVVNTDIRDEFKTCNVYAKPGCKDCFARFYCSGGCSANAYNFSGSINGAYDIGCEMQKKRIECAIMIKAALADDEE